MKKAIFGLALGAAIGACQDNKATLHPEYQSITHAVYASGIVKSRHEHQVFANVTGVLEALFVTEGDRVKKGQPLFQVSNAVAQLSRDNAAIAAQFNALPNNEDRLEDLSYAVDWAKQKMLNDSAMWARQNNLWQQGVGTKVELEQRTLAYQNAQSAHASALLKYQQLAKQLRFAAAQTQKNWQIASAQTRDLRVLSTIDGRVYAVLKNAGEMVSPQMPIVLLGDSRQFYLELEVDEYDITRVQTGQKVLFTMDSHRGESFEAVVSKIHPLMHPQSKTFTVEAQLTQQPDVLYPNLTVEANVVVSTKDRALLIPRNALVNDSFVVMANGERRRVSVGLRDYQKAEILNGLTDKDVILKPQKP